MDYLQKDLAKVLNVTQQQYSNIEIINKHVYSILVQI